MKSYNKSGEVDGRKAAAGDIFEKVSSNPKEKGGKDQGEDNFTQQPEHGLWAGKDRGRCGWVVVS